MSGTYGSPCTVYGCRFDDCIKLIGDKVLFVNTLYENGVINHMVFCALKQLLPLILLVLRGLSVFVFAFLTSLCSSFFGFRIVCNVA